MEEEEKTGGQKLRNSCGVRKGPEQTDLKKLIKKQTQRRYKKTLWVIHINTLVTHGLAMLHHKVATGQEQPI